jgi:hypothetical protein
VKFLKRIAITLLLPIAASAAPPGPRPLDRWTYIQVDDARGKWGDFDKPDWLKYYGLDARDVDADGDLDVIAGRYFYVLVTCEHKGKDKRLFVLENTGMGRFDPRVIDRGKESHLGTRLFDLDGDGDLDILSVAWDEYRYLHLWRSDAVRTPRPRSR